MILLSILRDDTNNEISRVNITSQNWSFTFIHCTVCITTKTYKNAWNNFAKWRQECEKSSSTPFATAMKTAVLESNIRRCFFKFYQYVLNIFSLTKATIILKLRIRSRRATFATWSLGSHASASILLQHPCYALSCTKLFNCSCLLYVRIIQIRSAPTLKAFLYRKNYTRLRQRNVSAYCKTQFVLYIHQEVYM